jgi:predicted nuclease of predicted toxin-antitoxin system
MKFVIDEDLPRSTGEFLQTLSHSVFDIRDVGLRGASDNTVYQFAQKHHAVLVSADLGFANILYFQPKNHHGIIVLRFPNTFSTNRMNQLLAFSLKLLGKRTLRGTLMIVSPKGIRLRRK